MTAAAHNEQQYTTRCMRVGSKQNLLDATARLILLGRGNDARRRQSEYTGITHYGMDPYMGITIPSSL